ncbi:MAG: hypothetical protein GYB31_18475 [Bacteroidetes bacterium]|nr:hypothetical protein [Bacteroidota bacterium]
MKYLHFNIIGEPCRHVVVAEEHLYLLDGQEYKALVESKDPDVLKQGLQMEKSRIGSMELNKKSREIVLLDYEGLVLERFQLSTRAQLKPFVRSFDGFVRQTSSSKRIRPMTALLFMGITYSFIWAGTRPESADINPEGIRLRLAYFVVQFMEWLNGIIGQELILAIGLFLLLVLVYLVFRPEIGRMVGNERVYINSRLHSNSHP